MQRMPDDFVDLIITSPPYDDLRDYHGCEWNLRIFQDVALGMYRILKPGGVVVWIVNDKTDNGSESLTSFLQQMYFRFFAGFNLHDTMIWEKPGSSNPSSNRYHQIFEYMFILSKGKPKTFNGIKDRKNLWQRRFGKGTVRGKDGELRNTKKDKIEYDPYGLRFNIWRHKTASQENIGQEIKHPAPFPEQLTADHIHTWSNPGELIYDPFGGSGTVAKKATQMGRNWIISEIAKEYATDAQKRVEPHLSEITMNFGGTTC